MQRGNRFECLTRQSKELQNENSEKAERKNFPSPLFPPFFSLSLSLSPLLPLLGLLSLSSHPPTYSFSSLATLVTLFILILGPILTLPFSRPFSFTQLTHFHYHKPPVASLTSLLHASRTRSLPTTTTAMAANQHTATQLAVSIPLTSSPSSSIAATRYPAPEPQDAPVPMPPIYVAGSTPVSTPTSGMHSPPLSGTLEEEANEKRAAHVASSVNRGQPSELGKSATPSSAAATTTSSSTNSNRALPGGSRSGGERRGSPSVTAATTSKTAKARPGAKLTQVKNQVNTQMHSSGAIDRPRDFNSSPHSVGPRTAVDHHFRPDLHQVRRPLSKEKTIEHVLQQGKILKVRAFT